MYQTKQAGMCMSSCSCIQDFPSLMSSLLVFTDKSQNIVIACVCNISCWAYVRKVVELIYLLFDAQCVEMDFSGVGCDFFFF